MQYIMCINMNSTLNIMPNVMLKVNQFTSTVMQVRHAPAVVDYSCHWHT